MKKVSEDVKDNERTNLDDNKNEDEEINQGYSDWEDNEGKKYVDEEESMVARRWNLNYHSKENNKTDKKNHEC